MRVVVLASLIIVAGGCYNYAPLSQVSPEPGTALAVTLTDSGTQSLARYIGPDVFVVRGHYVGSDDAGMRVAVSSVELVRGDERSWNGEIVTLPDNAVASLEVRRLAKGRSFLLAGAAVTGLVVSTAAFNLVGIGAPPSNRPPPAKK
jgi:hypothetical protein